MKILWSSCPALNLEQMLSNVQFTKVDIWRKFDLKKHKTRSSSMSPTDHFEKFFKQWMSIQWTWTIITLSVYRNSKTDSSIRMKKKTLPVFGIRMFLNCVDGMDFCTNGNLPLELLLCQEQLMVPDAKFLLENDWLPLRWFSTRWVTLFRKHWISVGTQTHGPLQKCISQRIINILKGKNGNIKLSIFAIYSICKSKS